MRSMSQAEPSAATSSRRSGFTLVEVLVVAPLVILILGALIAVIVVTTGSAMRATARSQLQNDVLAALDRIEQDVKLSITLKNSSAVQLNLDNLATSKNPLNPERKLIRRSDCKVAESGLALEDALRYWNVYFVAGNVLYHQTYLNNGCENSIYTVWQRHRQTEIMLKDLSHLELKIKPDPAAPEQAMYITLAATRVVAGEDIRFTGQLYVRSVNL